MTQQGNKPPVRRLDASGLTGQAPSASARQLPVERQAPRAERHEFRARPIEDYVRDAGNTVDEGQDDYDAGPVQPIGEPVPAPDDTEPSTVTLSRAYQAHGEPVRRVRFREPTGKQYRKLGSPRRFVVSDGMVQEGSLVVNMDVVAQYVVLLSDPPLPMSTVDQFTVSDLNACSRVINGFFNS